MGNATSSPRSSGYNDETSLDSSAIASFPGSNLVESALQCGNLDDDESLDNSNHGKRKNKSFAAQLLSHAENCVMSPQNSLIEAQDSDNDGDNGIRLKTKSEDDADHFFDEEYEELGRGRIKSKEKKQSKKKAAPKQNLQIESTSKPDNHSSALLAQSLMSEVGSPSCMSPNTMTQREKKLLKAQEKARQHNLKYGVSALKIDSGNPKGVARPIGSPSEGVGQATVLGTLAHAITGNYNDPISGGEKKPSDPIVLPPNSLSENRAAQVEQKRGTPSPIAARASGKHTVTIGLSLSRRSKCGHPDTVTRQTAFDFNELQDREYKYVSSTDSSGWAAGGGERGGNTGETEGLSTIGNSFVGPGTPNENTNKVPHADTVHIPIIQIDAESSQAVDYIISALARGEIFIPHMAIIPEALSVNGVSPPDLVVRFGTERNDDLPPDEWPNWCLEFMHNQLYEYFHGMGARWMKRPFSITLAKKVRWKTVKHMNRYFSHAERVIDAWREKGPQYLDPQLAYVDGATPEEVARPHGIYLMRNGVPTNYFAPNFNPPYTTKMTRSLLFNVLGKSWDRKRREWTSNPIPKLITPSMLVSAMCGCSDNHASGFLATEATYVEGPVDRSTMLPADHAIRSLTPKTPKNKPFDPSSPLSSQKKKKKKEQRKSVTPVPMPSAQNTKMPSQRKMATDGSPSEPLSPKIELNVSSSSASFIDEPKDSDSIDIPAPPAEAEKKREARDPEPLQTVEPLQNVRQTLEPQEQRQDRQKEKRSETGENNENSGDSKNHESVSKKEDEKMKKKQETKVVSDEDWLNDVETSTKSEYKTLATLQAEQGRQIQVRSVVQAQTSTPFLSDKGPGSPTVRSNNSSKSSRNAMLNKSHDMGTLSMEYSVDESTLIGCDKSVGASTFIGCDKSVGTFDSTLLGQNFAVDSKSVLSVVTKEPLVVKEVLEEVPEKTSHTQRSAVTTASSYSTWDEPVPSDEELFAAGWAKALDSNSGSYYYFTLDRKKTCWDNPLAPPVSPTNSEENSVQ